EEAFSKTAKIVQEYSDRMVKRWNEEIDTLLVYAGLFSAILTAFNVQSYQLLQKPSPDPARCVGQPYVAATVPDSQAEPWAAALNILWFSGLICSLASASVGIMVKQWTHECQSGLSGSSP
ncbi:hypothetical protein DICSQDRAFT_56106, partial [Dichomitus squalens LYAD-421 SS1]|uniref:uncharacterized protein n=1 Tax=Dichomitus squalens (strain LYAD-421) TaxID=732165 RepID=UPI000441273D